MIRDIIQIVSMVVATLAAMLLVFFAVVFTTTALFSVEMTLSVAKWFLVSLGISLGAWFEWDQKALNWACDLVGAPVDEEGSGKGRRDPT